MDTMSTQKLPTLAALRRQAEAVQQWADGKVADFNARPARRCTDFRVQGWRLVEPEVAA